MRLTKDERNAARAVLRAWGLQGELPRFLGCADGLALVAHLCNAGAKYICADFYELKPMLVEAAAEASSFAWHREGVVYIETSVGQVSFHVFEDEGRDLAQRDELTGPWAGGFMQDGALQMALAWLSDEPVATARFEKWLEASQPRSAA